VETRNGFEVLFAVLMPIMHSESLADHRKAEAVIAQLVSKGEKEEDATLVGMLNQTSSYMAQHTRVLEVSESAHTCKCGWTRCALTTTPFTHPSTPTHPQTNSPFPHTPSRALSCPVWLVAALRAVPEPQRRHRPREHARGGGVFGGRAERLGGQPAQKLVLSALPYAAENSCICFLTSSRRWSSWRAS
jgi:hypothetical protein